MTLFSVRQKLYTEICHIVITYICIPSQVEEVIVEAISSPRPLLTEEWEWQQGTESEVQRSPADTDKMVESRENQHSHVCQTDRPHRQRSQDRGQHYLATKTFTAMLTDISSNI